MQLLFSTVNSTLHFCEKAVYILYSMICIIILGFINNRFLIQYFKEREVNNMVANYFKTNWKDMLSVLFFLICYATSILLFLGGVQDQTRPSDLEFTVFLPFAIADIVFIIVFIILEIKIFKMKLNIPLIIVLSSLFIVNLLVIATTPLENSFDYVFRGEAKSILVNITNEWKIMYALCFFLLLMNIYISFNYLVYRVNFKKHFTWICLLCVSVAFFLVIYSYIVEWNTYKLFIENISWTVRIYNPQSLTNNPNSYAAILLGGAFCCYGLNAVFKKHIFWIIGLFFCINTVFPMSRICLLLSIILTFLFITYKIIISWKDHTFRNINFILLILFGIGLFTAICLTIPEVRIYIEYNLFTGNSSLNLRIPLWEIVISMTKGIHCFVGNGHGYFNTSFALITEGELKMPHCLYIQTYGALGFLGLAFLVVLICFIIYKVIRLYKNNRDASIISIIGLIIVLLYYLVEG